ncbi:acyl-CoA-binding protein [Flavobacterium orientale]|uniref:Acyl-CoA-binding protein n=1 Tax=Flavobacterium orientale TaxID=1756020 RepID=A0A916Y621_9FLAO|nr:acyl-CoA-binding protein [Flavobacterium orientale]GGD32883.1 acyl-CoA-binding protein [Flavobacterium orientale]
MSETDLDRRFNEAFELASNMTETLPPDVMLRIYAYYKQATHGTVGFRHINNSDLRNAFKTNAWMQISHLTPDEAKERYIETINSLLKK